MKVIPLAVVAFVSAASCASLAPGAANTPTGRASASAEAVSAAPTGSAAAQSGRSAAPSTTGSPTPAERAARAPALTAQRSGADLVITLSGLTPGEGGELTVRWSTRAPTGPITADATGEVHLRVLVGDDAPIEVVVRRASGEELRAAVGPSQAAPSAVPAVAAVPPSVVAPSGAPPSQTPTSRAGPRFTVAIDPPDPAPGTVPDIVVSGLLAGEAFQLEVAVGGMIDVYQVRADPTGFLRWRSLVTMGTAFQVAAERVTGQRASTALSGPAPTPTPTACPPSSADPARTGIDGYLRWGWQPVGGIRVELRGNVLSPDAGVLYGSAMSGGDGYFAITGIPRSGVLYDVLIPEQAPYARLHMGQVVLCPQRLTRVTNYYALEDNLAIVRLLTGLSVRNLSEVAAGPLDLAWDPVPRAGIYCVSVEQLNARGEWIPVMTESCGGRTGRVEVSTNAYRTPPLLTGRTYQICVEALAREARGYQVAEGCARSIQIR